MNQRTRLSLFVVQALIISLMMALLGRLFYLQVAATGKYKEAALNIQSRDIVVPATRGLIVDASGVPLAMNRVGLVQLIWLRWQAWSHVRVMGGRPRFAIESLMSIRHAAGAMFLITAMGMMLSQVDKVVLAFLVPLESLGHYTLAWGLASGLTIIATPIVQGFGARFSALASNGTQEELETQIKLASQLTYALVIPPAVTISLFAESIMLAWVRDSGVASASAPLFALLAIGTAMVACTYPLLIALYAQKDFRPVLLIQLLGLLLFFPLLLWLVDSLGVLGAALCWSIYGAGLFTIYLVLMATRQSNRLSLRLLRTFILVAVGSAAIVWAIKHILRETAIHGERLWLIGMVLVAAWLLSASFCPDLRRGITKRLIVVRISMSDHQ